MNNLKIAQISDLHLWKISYDLSQFFSKRWIGNLNLLLYRKNRFHSNQLWLLIDKLERLNVDYLFICGDLTSTSLKEEFSFAKIFISEVEKKGIKVFVVPGNHDKYTKTSHKNNTFYKFFNNVGGNLEIEKKFSLEQDSVQAVKIADNYFLVTLDTAISTHLFSSRGDFSEKIEKNLKNLLLQIPEDNKIIIINHFPFVKTKSPRKALKRSRELKKILKANSNIILFLHGHTHNHKIQDFRKKNLPIVLDSGSASHNSIGKWNLIEISENMLDITPYKINKEKDDWIEMQTKNFKIL